jgi:hypothetical protein
MNACNVRKFPSRKSNFHNFAGCFLTMLRHNGLNENDVNENTSSEPVCEESFVQNFELTSAAIEGLEQAEQVYSVNQRKVTLRDPRSPLKNAIQEGSEYEGSDEKSPNLRKDMKSLASNRPRSAKLQASSRPDSAKAKRITGSTKLTSSLLLDALLTSQGCPGPSIQAEALEASHRGQLTCLLRLSVFIWPIWLDEVVGTSTNKLLSTNSGVVLEMSHQEVIQQLNSLCHAQESGQNKGAGQSDATVHHMVNICVKRCSELMRAHDFKTTKQIHQKIIQLSRRVATTARNQLKLLPLKLIAAMLHIGDGNIRDAVFELRSAIECIPVDQSDVKPFISTDVAILYNHLSYYYSLLGSRAEACKYTKMGIDVMAENRSTMARSDMSTQYLSVDEVSARHQYMDAVLMLNQVVAEVSNEHADIEAAKALCSDAVMYLEEAGTCTTCVSHLTTRLLPMFENIQKVLDGKKHPDGHSKFPFSPGAVLPAAGGDRAKTTQGNRISFTGSVRVSKPSASNQTVSGYASHSKNASATTKQSKLDLSASFGMVRSQSQIYSVKTPKAKAQPPLATSRPSSGVRSSTSSPKTRTQNSKFKMLMLGPALAKGNEHHQIPCLLESNADQDNRSKLPECLIQALFPPSFHSSKILASVASAGINARDIFDADSNEVPSPHEAAKISASRLNLKHRSEQDQEGQEENRPSQNEYQSTKSNERLRSSDRLNKILDVDSLRICCNLIQSLTCSFDSLEEMPRQQMKLAAHCASKLACDICYLFKLEGKFPDCTRATTVLSSGKQVSADFAQGGILTTQMNRFLQNGVLMRQVAILDDDNFTETGDDLDQAVLPINASECSIMMGVIPGCSQFNQISGFMMAIRSSPAASFDPKELLVCELLCNCCSQSLPLL